MPSSSACFARMCKLLGARLAQHDQLPGVAALPSAAIEAARRVVGHRRRPRVANADGRLHAAAAKARYLVRQDIVDRLAPVDLHGLLAFISHPSYYRASRCQRRELAARFGVWQPNPS